MNRFVNEKVRNKKRTSETSESSETSEASETSKTSETLETSEASETSETLETSVSFAHPPSDLLSAHPRSVLLTPGHP